MKEKIQFDKVRDFGQLISTTLTYSFRNLRGLTKTFLYLVLPAMAIGALCMVLVFQQIFQMENGMDSFNAPVMIVAMILLYAGIFISSILLIAAGYSYSIEYYHSEFGEVAVSAVWKRTKECFWRVLGTILAMVVVIMLPILIVVGIIAGLASAFGDPSGFAIFFIVIISIAMFVLLYYFVVRWYFVIYIRITEKLGLVESFKRSAYLVDNNWWKTFGVIFVLSIIQNALSLIVYIPMYIVMVLGMMTGIESNGDVSIMAMSAMGLMFFVYYVFVMFLAFIFLNGAVIQFHSLKEEKEGTSLFDKVDEIGTKKDSLFENEGEF